MESKKTKIHPELKKFGLQVKLKRVEKGWTQEQLALQSGHHVNYLGGIERGVRNASLLTILQLAKTFNCPVSDFFK